MEFRALLIIVLLAVVLPWPAGAVTREELVCPVREDWGAQEWEQWETGERHFLGGWSESGKCPCKERWEPSEEQLQKILTAHKKWLDNMAILGPANVGQAILCNAYLRKADLQGARLALARLQEVDLQDANLEKAFLQAARLQKADLAFANLQEADLSPARLQEANLWNANLQKASLRGATLKEADLGRADP